jgi:Mannosylglycerate hydrolase MGH1-like glycoside hydrolase domain/Trehalase
MNSSANPPVLPVNLNLSADQRFSTPDYANDQTWELLLRGGDPQALSLQTTYGLRAIRMNFFPRFLQDDLDLIDPQDFYQPPQITAAYPNFARILFSPLENLLVTMECWVPASQVLAMRLNFANQGNTPLQFTFELVGILQPFDPGQRLATVSSNLTNILQGHTGELAPVCFMTGGPFPGIGPYAGLAQHFVLNPGHERAATAAIAALSDENDSLKLAKNTTSCAWDEEIAKIERVNQVQRIDISTGNPEWDACFARAQSTAYGLFLPASEHLPHPSFVQSRRPDHGHSLRGDGSDYPHQWSGQTALDGWYLNAFLLPGGLTLAKGVLENFLSVQEENGDIDWKPGLAGQRSRQLAQPLLAALAWQIYEINQDDAWLETCFIPLLKFFTAWFTAEHDADEDGLPEWKHALQTGFPNAPIYNRWQQGGQGADIAILECPSLAGFLFNECRCLIKIAGRLQKTETLPWLETKSEELSLTISGMWNARSKTYRYRDYATENSNKGRILRKIKGRGQFKLDRHFKTPQRLQIQLNLANNDTRPLKITLKGRNERRKVSETIGFAQLHWSNGKATCTTNNVFMQLDEVNIRGLSPDDTGTLASVDYAQEDISLLLPLWAGAADQQTAKTLIEKTILPRYLKKFGLSATPQSSKEQGEEWKSAVHMPWNHLVGEALLAYGYRTQAAKLVTNLMKAHTQILAKHRHFHEVFHANTGEPGGEESILTGLPPLGLYLKVLGIKRLTANELIVEGHNPFPKPVTIRFQTVEITRQKKNTIVTLQSGETLTLRGPGPHRVQFQ